MRPKFDPNGPVGIVIFTPLERGGGRGGGTKSIVRTVAMVAILIAATAVTGGAAAIGGVGFGTTGTLFAAGSISASIAGSAIPLDGGLEIDELRALP